MSGLKWALGLVVIAGLAPAAVAATQGNEHWKVGQPRCDEFRAAWKAMSDSGRYRGKLSLKFVNQMIAYQASNCTRQMMADFETGKQDRQAYEELMSGLKAS